MDYCSIFEMSLDKAIKSGKEHRKPYYKSESFDTTCRPHGGCPWCYGNRMHKHRRNADAYNDMLDNALEKIDRMSIDDFEHECIEAGYTPTRKNIE